MEILGESVASFVVERSLGLLIEEVKHLHGVSDQVDEIRTELRRMKSFLIEADATRDERATFKNRVEEIREISLETEDVVETFVIKVESRRRPEGNICSFLQRYICILNEFIERHQIGSELQGIKKRISEITRSLQTYKQIPKSERERSSLLQKKLQMRRTYSHIDQEFVGKQENVDELVKQLVDESKNRGRVVSICGMGGIGKTTLAREVYKSSRVRSHFDVCVWTCISQQWETKDVLQGILTQLIKDIDNVRHLSVDELFKQIFEFQKKKKCLIVLDDIWSIDAWECLKDAFPTKETGSKIMLTTRNKRVPKRVDKDGFHHKLQLLTPDESWELLQKNAFTQGQNSGDQESMMELGRKLAKRCGGLPLGVVVLGGILAGNQKLSEWEKVDRDLNLYSEWGIRIGETHGRVSEVLALSYSELPYHLKSCFLCLGNFPKNSDIDVDKLYKIWMAEGLLLLDHNRADAETTLMDVAESYLEELANRFMVELKIVDEHLPWSFLSCRLHDRMRELCLLKGKEENFLEFINNIRSDIRDSSSSSSSSSISKARRLSLYSDTSVSLIKQLGTTRHLRSLLFSYDTNDIPNQVILLKEYFKHFKLLRVLILQVYFSEEDEIILPNEIGSLIHLRYLSIRNSGFSKLPSSLGNLEYLQTLDLVIDSRLHVQNVLSKMRRLVHLYLPKLVSQSNKLELDGLSNLETLENFHPRLCSAKDLSKLTNLRKLILTVDNSCEFEDLEVIIEYLNIESNRLRYTFVAVPPVSRNENYEQYSDILTRLLGCRHLDRMVLFFPIAKLPEYNICFLPRLTKLYINSSALSEDPMKTLEKLPKLLSLTITDFKGQDMVCSTRGFPQLKFLELHWLENLENWRVDEGAMPCLTHLTINFCEELKMLPDGLKSVTTLKELKLTRMSKAFANRLRVQGEDGKKGEDFYKVEHVPYITLTTDDDP